MDLKGLDLIAQDDKASKISVPSFATVARVSGDFVFVIMDGDKEELPSGLTKFGHVVCEAGDRVHIMRDNGVMYINASNRLTSAGSEYAKIEYVDGKFNMLDESKINKLVKYYSASAVAGGATPNNILDGSFMINSIDNPIQGFCYYEQFFYGLVGVESNRIQHITSYNTTPIRSWVRRFFNGVWLTSEIMTEAIVNQLEGENSKLWDSVEFLFKETGYIPTEVANEGY